VLQLNATPAANDFLAPESAKIVQQEYPLYLSQCDACGHVQLPVVVSPETLFSDYVYVSGTSPSFVKHFKDYATDMIRRFGLCKGDLVIDIGSNDGTLLRFFKAAGMRVLGVDPARLIAEEATSSGIETICSFFDRDLATSILSKYGPASLVLANNVFAHADDLREIAEGVKSLLQPIHGHFVFEVQYLVDLIESTLFDMCYHEHLSYHSIMPLLPFFKSIGMSLTDISLVPTHGGSIRVFVQNDIGIELKAGCADLLKKEQLLMKGDPFGDMDQRVKRAGEQLRDELNKVQGIVVGYGAPAKLTTLMYQFEIPAKKISYVVDDSPWKQGLLTPGKHIVVSSPERLFDASEKPELIIIFAWNFADQIIAKYPQFKGSFIVPLPTLRKC
jgi:SAM-dependent methyltransferase